MNENEMMNRMNGEDEMNLSVFEKMNRMRIGSNSLQGIRNLTMNGLNELIELSIGNCSLNRVERVEIGSNSLNSLSYLNMSSLSKMRILDIGSESMNELRVLNARRLVDLRRMNIGESSLVSIEE